MKGDPKPLDRQQLASDLSLSLKRMRRDSEQALAEAEAKGNEKHIRETQRVLAEIDKLEGS